MTNTAALPLALAYRLRTSKPDAYGMFLGHDVTGGHMKEVPLADGRRLAKARPDLFQVISEGRHKETHLVIADGPKPSLAELVEELERSGANRSTAQLELVAAVLARGDMPGTYGNTYWSDEDAALHLFSCGPKWDRFGGVTSERWSEWHGTFAEDTDEDRLEVSFDCRCGEEFQVRFGLEPPSLAQLFVSLEAGVIEKLFGV